MFIEPEDLAPFADIAPAKAAAMIEDAEASAVLVAPCLPGLTIAPDPETPEEAVVRLAKLAAVKAILRAALLRWEEAGSGGVTATQRTAGPFSEQNSFQSVGRKGMFWPSEIESLQGICSSAVQGKAYAVESVNREDPTAHLHTPWCSYRFGALYCSCGVDLTGSFPLYEVGG